MASIRCPAPLVRPAGSSAPRRRSASAGPCAAAGMSPGTTAIGRRPAAAGRPPCPPATDAVRRHSRDLVCARAKRDKQDNKEDEDMVDLYCTPPVNRATKECPSELLLSEGSVSPNPLWGTFTSNVAGAWVGHSAAFYAETGEREAVALGEDGRTPLFDIDVLCLETRDESGDLSRAVTRVGGGEEETAQTLSASSMSEGDSGLVYFEDGSYSRGPTSLCSEVESGDNESEGDEEGAGGRDDVRVVEQCIARAGHNRVRIAHTLTARPELAPGGGGRELDVEVLRLTVSFEHWKGPAGMELGDDFLGEEAATKGPFSERERAAAEDMNGEWRVFTRVVFPIAPSARDPEPGFGRRYVSQFVYSTEESLQQWQATTWEGLMLAQELAEAARDREMGEKEEGGGGEAASWAGGGGRGGGDAPPDGVGGFDDDRFTEGGQWVENEDGTLAQEWGGEGAGTEMAEFFFGDVLIGCTVWLPEGISATVRMGGGGDDGGLTVGVEWVDKSMGGAVQGMERVYDSRGDLVEVRNSSSIQGAWAGGRM